MVLTRENIFTEFLPLRLKHKKTQAEVSKGSGVSRVSISGIESKTKKGEKIREETLYRLNDYFDNLGEK